MVIQLGGPSIICIFQMCFGSYGTVFYPVQYKHLVTAQFHSTRIWCYALHSLCFKKLELVQKCKRRRQAKNNELIHGSLYGLDSQGDGNLRAILVLVCGPVFLNLPQSYTWSSKKWPIHILNWTKCLHINILFFDFYIPSLLSLNKVYKFS